MSIAVIDLETTGFNPKYHEVVEVGLVIIRREKITERFSSLVWPGEDYFAFNRALPALTKQGRTVDSFRGAPRTMAVSRKLKVLLDGCDITSFNVAFERGFLDKGRWLGHNTYRWPFCLMEVATKIMGEAGSPFCPWDEYHHSYKWPKLSQAAEFFKVPYRVRDLHGAAADVDLAARIYFAMRQRGDL